MIRCIFVFDFNDSRVVLVLSSRFLRSIGGILIFEVFYRIVIVLPSYFVGVDLVIMCFDVVVREGAFLGVKGS
jgi:hypothetical protein